MPNERRSLPDIWPSCCGRVGGHAVMGCVAHPRASSGAHWYSANPGGRGRTRRTCTHPRTFERRCLAIIMGGEQPRRSVVSRRRRIRRSPSASFRHVLGFTRNPSRRLVLEKADTSFAAGFRVSPNNHATKPGDIGRAAPASPARGLTRAGTCFGPPLRATGSVAEAAAGRLCQP